MVVHSNYLIQFQTISYIRIGVFTKQPYRILRFLSDKMELLKITNQFIEAQEYLKKKHSGETIHNNI